MLTRLKRTLLKSRRLPSQLRLRSDVRVAASQRSSSRRSEKPLLLSRHLKASLAAGASNSATGTDLRLMIRIAPCHRSRLTLQARVASAPTAIAVAQSSSLMSRVDARLLLPSPRTTTTAGGSSRPPILTTWVVRCLVATTRAVIKG